MTVNQNDNPGLMENKLKRYLYFLLNFVIFVFTLICFLIISSVPSKIYQSFGYEYMTNFLGFYGSNLIFDFIIIASVKTCIEIWKLGFPNFRPFYSKLLLFFFFNLKFF